MKGSISLGRYAGIKVLIHWTFLILPAWVAYFNLKSGKGWEAVFWNVLFILAIFFCVTLHEFGHALMAKKFKFKTKDITLLPIGGVARMEELPENPKQELLVAIAGPLVNFAIAGILSLLPIYSSSPLDIDGNTAFGADNFLFFLMVVNLVLGLFNLIPAFPMDGGRVLRALLSFKMSRHLATFIAARLGQAIAIAFAALGLFYNPFLLFIAIFVFIGAQAEYSMVHSKFMLGDHKVGEMIMRQYHTLNADDSLSEATALLLDTDSTNFLVMDSDRIVGTLTSSTLINSLADHDENTPVSEVMNTHLKVVNPDTPLKEIYASGERVSDRTAIMPVVEGNRLLGVIDIENIMEFITVQQAKNQRRRSQSPA